MEKTRGGKRANAGRKATNRTKHLHVRITEKAWLKLQEMKTNASEYIDELILQQ